MEPPPGTVPRHLTVIVCRGPTCGDQRGSAELYDHLEVTIAAKHLGDRVALQRETCLGHCLRGPNILVCDTADIAGEKAGPGAASAVLYNRMTVSDLDRVIDRHLGGGMVVRPFLHRPPVR